MATVIYKPKDDRHEKMGEFVSSALSSFFQARMERDKQQKESAIMQDILSAPDRQTAIERAISTTTDPQTLQRRINIVNELKPVKDTTPIEVKGYNPETGVFESKFLPRGQLESLSTPEGRRSAFGSGEAIISPTDIEEFFRQTPEGYESIGKAPMQARPEQAISATELERQRKERADDLAERRQRFAEERFNALLAKGDTKAIAQEMAKTKAYNSVVANLLNVRKSIGDQGQIILDFEGDSKKAESYRNALESADEYLSKFKGDINKAAVNALKDSGYYTKTEEPPAPAAAPAEEKGFFKRIFSPSAKTPATEAKPTTPAPKAEVAKPITKAEFDKLPSGAHYINPKDGKEYIKE